MKLNFVLLTLLFALLVSTQGCKKDDSNNSVETISVSIQTNQIYQYDLGTFGIEEGTSIIQQAAHFQVSKTERQTDTGNILYTYTPQLDYEGTDQVVINAMRGSDGASASTNIKTYIFHFTITK
jgi:hypothetical protein